MKIDVRNLNIKEGIKTQTIVLFEEIDNSFVELVKKEIDKPITLISFNECDWNKDFAPWPSENFIGEGDNTLKQVIEIIKENKFTDLLVMGYSLGGLMAIYMLSKYDDIKYCASVSGSLWYPNLIEYLSKTNINNKKIYLSLGKKESKTKHPLMSTVDDKTRQVKEILEKTNDVFFEYNDGNHFYEVEKRMLKAIKYLLKEN